MPVLPGCGAGYDPEPAYSLSGTLQTDDNDNTIDQSVPVPVPMVDRHRPLDVCTRCCLASKFQVVIGTATPLQAAKETRLPDDTVDGAVRQVPSATLVMVNWAVAAERRGRCYYSNSDRITLPQ